MPNYRRLIIRGKRGMTLVELLIVIAVIVTVSAILLPSIKDALKDQKIKQASRQLVGLIESCKAEALATGRPVGISIERLNIDSQEGMATSIQISKLEQLPPYSGDFQEAGAYFGATAVSGTLDQVFTTAYIPVREAAALGVLASVGDSITFGDQKQRFLITNIVASNWTPPDGSPPEPHFAVSFRNQTNFPPYTTLLPVTGVNSAVKVPFRIFRKPVRNELAVLQLPRGICIDLSCSGLSSTEFSTKAISGLTAPPLRDYGPVSILFSPSGEIERVSLGAQNLVRSDVPVTDIYLLLGKIDGVSPVNELEPYNLVTGTVDSQASALVGNLMSSESIWIKISRSTGRVNSAAVDGISSPVTSLAQRLAESRATVQSGLSEGGR